VVQCASLVSLSFDIKKRIFIAVKKVYWFSFDIVTIVTCYSFQA
jgi:hypothetical protein